MVIFLISSCGKKDNAVTDSGIIGVADSCFTKEHSDTIAIEEEDSVITICPKETPLKMPDQIIGLFGRNDAFIKRDGQLKEPMPSINGLYTKSRLVNCPNDTCYSKRILMAARCPNNRVLRKWMIEQMNFYVTSTFFDSIQTVEIPSALTPIKKTVDYYVNTVGKKFAKYNCVPERIGEPMEQWGYLITDVWQEQNYCTFLIANWYDMLSCGNNILKKSVTVDRRNGRVLDMKSLFDEKDHEKLSVLMLSYLENHVGHYISKDLNQPLTAKGSLELLERADGIALIKGGVMIFYHPYNISYGADGSFYALIPYKEFEATGITLSVNLYN